MGASCCHGNYSFDLINPKTLFSLSPTPVMLHINLIKISQLALEIFKFESVDDGRRRTDDGPLLYYKSPCELKCLHLIFPELWPFENLGILKLSAIFLKYVLAKDLILGQLTDDDE